MSNVDVGDAVELTFNTAFGATVTAAWFDPDEVEVFADQPVAEAPPASGRYPYTFLPTRAGVWWALFTASGAAVAVERHYVRASPVDGPPPLAVLGDVVGQYGELTLAQQGLVGSLLRAASSIVRGRLRNIDAAIAAGTLDPNVAAIVVTNMIIRVLRNPGGLRSETAGPFTRTYDTGYAGGLLILHDWELGMLTPVLEHTAIGVRTIPVRPGLAGYPLGYSRAGW